MDKEKQLGSGLQNEKGFSVQKKFNYSKTRLVFTG